LNRALNQNGSSLIVGERVVSKCEDGLLEAEYALFDRSEVLLASGAVSGAGGHGVREEGYMTTAGFARARLHEALVTADLAYEAFAAMRGRHMRPLGRSTAVVEIIDQLGPYEAFEGGTFVAERGRYTGVWLDLDTLAAACPLREAPVLFQALHLLLVLEEVNEDVPVRLLTAPPNADGRAGERSWRKIDLDSAQRLPWLLREMQAPTRTRGSVRDEAEVREEILRSLQARATSTTTPQPRLHTLATAIARTGWTPPAGLPVEAAPVTKRYSSSKPPRQTPPPPRPSSRPPPPGTTTSPRPSPPPPPPAEDSRVADNADASEDQSPDPVALFEQLRKQTELLRGDDHLRAVAQSLSALVERSAFVPDLAMLASRAWLAAGEQGYARYFAKRIVEDASISDDLRIAALEILDSTPRTFQTSRPPPSEAIQPARVIVLSGDDRPVPPGASLPPMAPAPPAPVAIQHPEMTAPAPAPMEIPRPARVPAAPWVPPPPTGRPEIVETLALPEGLSESMLAAGLIPRDEVQARIAMTRLARQLGRDYRLAYGTTLKTDLMAVDAMQRHIRRRFADGQLDEAHARQLQVELTRHGALMSEILARVLGATWADLSPEEPGRWAMTVPVPHAQPLTVWPIGRVYRYYGQGHREADLVAFFMELEAAARPRR
jgi:hypothetical protein